MSRTSESSLALLSQDVALSRRGAAAVVTTICQTGGITMATTTETAPATDSRLGVETGNVAL